MDAGGGGLGGGGGTVLNGDNNIMNANTITAAGDITINITPQIAVAASRLGTADLASLHEHFRQLVAEKTRGFLPRSRRWLRDPDGACVRVLLGDPGVGKSAAVMYLRKSVNLAKRVAAFHVCDAVRNPKLTVLDFSLFSVAPARFPRTRARCSPSAASVKDVRGRRQKARGDGRAERAGMDELNVQRRKKAS